MDEDFWSHLKSVFVDGLFSIVPTLIYAAISIGIGLFLIKFLMRTLKRVLRKSHVELSLQTFIESLSTFLLYGILFFIIGRIIGIQASSFLAVFGAAGIAIGLALQGSLANFAGGVLILVFKPFRVDDLVYIHETLGLVQEINILYTRIKTYDGRIVTMPNGNLSNNDVDNRSMEPYRRVEVKLNFSFDEDFDQLREVITAGLKQHPKLVKDKPVQVWLNGIGDYSMQVSARCWSNSEDYWDVYWDQMENVKKALDKNDIHLAIPKRAIYQANSPEEKKKEH